MRRLVFHIGGYDPVPPEAAHRRFVRELGRFAGTWSAKVSASPPDMRADEAAWRIVAVGPNWRGETDYRFVRWDDVMAAASRRPIWRRIPLGLIAFADFIAAGALWGYLRTNWRYALFFLYPVILFALIVAGSVLAGMRLSDAVGFPFAGVLAGALAFAALVYGARRWLYLDLLFDDWIFSHRYIRYGDPVLDGRLDRLAHEIAKAARAGEVDEIVIVGHSLGAVLGIDLLNRAIELDPALGRSGAGVALLSVGSSILKIGLHRGARRLHAAMVRVASEPGPFWAEYQALTDPMNFYKTDPMAVLGLPACGRPVVRIVRIRDMLDPAAYRRIRRNFFRVHCQFISGNDRRAPYDYFMLLCGPLSVERQVRSPDGAVSAIGPDGALLDGPAAEPARARFVQVSPG